VSIKIEMIEGEPEPFRPGALAAGLERLVNGHRRSLGLEALSADDTLRAAALAHAERMRTGQFFAHVDPETRTDPMARVDAIEPGRWQVIAENLIAGVWTSEQALDGWLNSAGHRANLERREVSMIGTAVLAVPAQRSIIVQLYGRRFGSVWGDLDRASHPRGNIRAPSWGR